MLCATGVRKNKVVLHAKNRTPIVQASVLNYPSGQSSSSGDVSFEDKARRDDRIGQLCNPRGSFVNLIYIASLSYPALGNNWYRQVSLSALSDPSLFMRLPFLLLLLILSSLSQFSPLLCKRKLRRIGRMRWPATPTGRADIVCVAMFDSVDSFCFQCSGLFWPCSLQG